LEIPEGASACPACGTSISVAQLGPIYVPESSLPPVAIPDLPQVTAPRVERLYAGFWLRAIAYLIDTVIVSMALALVASAHPSTFIIFPPAGASPFAIPQLTPIALGITIPIVWLYYAVFEASVWQATPGKLALKLYVTDLSGHRISFARASLRHFGKIISGLTFLVGYLLAGFTAKKQALHDFLASCLVLRRS
jgi:uncharacterized RDD family membrane protein YckC